MPYLMNTSDRVDALVEVAIVLVESEGVEALTLRKLASRLGLSPSTLTSHLTNKHRMIDLIAKRIGSAIVRSVEAESVRRGLDAAVPDDDLVPAVRAWLALSELARADDDMDAGVARIRADLRHLLGWIGRVPPGDEVTRDALAALTAGIWEARCSRTEPMTARQARAVLRHVCAALGVRVEPEPDAA